MDNEGYQHFSKPIMEVIKSGYSVRTYHKEKLSEEVKSQLREYAKGIKGSFTPKVRLEFIDSHEILEKTGGKIGKASSVCIK